MEEIYKILSDIKPEVDYRSSKDFVKDELLDSFDMITLVDMLEEKYQIKIDALDILPENFCNAEAIAALVEKSGGKI